MDTFYPLSCRRRERSLTVSNFIPAFAASPRRPLKRYSQNPAAGRNFSECYRSLPHPATLPAGRESYRSPLPS